MRILRLHSFARESQGGGGVEGDKFLLADFSHINYYALSCVTIKNCHNI